MNRGSVHLLSMRYSEDQLASLRRLQEYLGLFMHFVWRHHQAHTDMWNNNTNAKSQHRRFVIVAALWRIFLRNLLLPQSLSEVSSNIFVL
jgi:hypothetical protein